MRYSILAFLFVWFAPFALGKFISSENAESICKDAGIDRPQEAENYHWYFSRWEKGLYFAATASYRTKANFFNSGTGKFEEKDVIASADYREALTADANKPLQVQFEGGIANLKHSTTNFKLYLGYKTQEKDNWIEMNFVEAPVTQYTRFSVEVKAGSLVPGPSKIWFEGRYRENDQEIKVYESNNGSDYLVKVTETALKTVCFANGWREALNGNNLKAFEAIKIVYGHDRILPLLYGTTYNGYPAWTLEGHYLIKNRDSEIVESGSLPGIAYAHNPQNGSSATERAKFAPYIFLPKASSGGQIEFWFQGHARGGSTWESAHGTNYVLRIE